VAVGDARQLAEDGLVEGGDPQVERELEAASFALEVLVELAAHLVERDAEHADSEAARELLLLPADGVGDPAETARGRGDEELADR